MLKVLGVTRMGVDTERLEHLVYRHTKQTEMIEMTNLTRIAKTLEDAKLEYSAKVRILMFELTTTENTFDVVDIAGQVEELSGAMGQFVTALEALEDENESTGGAVEHFLEAFGVDIKDAGDAEEALTRFHNAFVGETSMREYAETVAEEIKDQYGMCDVHAAYIDVYSILRDLDASGELTEGGPFLFHSNW